MVDESVQYTYEAGGLRTQLELPDAKTIVYTYDERGQLIGLEDWDNQVLNYSYDLAGRMRSAENDNGLERRHDYDASGRLRQIAYATPDTVLGHFAYEVDARGNRVSVTEALKSPSTGNTSLLSDDEAVDYYKGTWSPSGAYMASTNFSAALRLAFLGDEITLTLGQDDDHGICDIYVNNVLWGSLDTYAPSAGDEAVTLNLDSDGPHVLDIRNRPAKHKDSTGYRLAFKQLVVNSQYDQHTVNYTYDGLSRLWNAASCKAAEGIAFRNDAFTYDRAGNRRRQAVVAAASATVTDYWVDAANRLDASDVNTPTYDVEPGDVAGLIAAIEAANVSMGSSTIRLAPGSVYTLNAVHNNIQSANGLPAISDEVIIQGNGATIIRDPDAPAFRIFMVTDTGDLTLSDLLVLGGETSHNITRGGGAIRNEGTLTLTNVTFENHQSFYGGGAIFNASDLTATDCTFAHNTQTGSSAGGGIISIPGSSLDLTRCILAHNTAGGGGGIATFEDAVVTLDNCTLTANTALIVGGGIYAAADGTFTISDSLFSNNVAGDQGGGIYIQGSGDIDIADCRFMHNTAENNGGAISSWTIPNTWSANNNWIEANGDTAVHNNASSVTLDFQSNWWGAADGPSGEGSGSGDSVSTYVDYSSYLTSAPSGTYSYTPPTDNPPMGADDYTYNNAGQLTDDGTLTYSWDRGGRLLSAGSSAYEYNGLGQRLRQTVSSIVTDYLLDLQPGLSKVLAATTGADVDRFVHTPQGIQAIQDNAGDWLYTVQDGLGSVRSVVDESFDVLYSQHYAPYGEPFGESGTSQTDFGFTGEPTDGNGLVHLRARYLNPSLGVFPSLDPAECNQSSVMSLNKYSYVSANLVNLVDPSGMIGERPSKWDSCQAPNPSVDPCDEQLNFEVSNCPLRDNSNGVNALAWTAYLETAGSSGFADHDPTVVAIMLAQLNFFKSFGYWNGKIGDSQNVTLENITDDDVTAKVLPRFKTIAEKIMNAHCGRKNPLACLNSNAYPTLWENRRLLLISWVTEANSFSSFHAERIHCPGINERGEEPACIEDDNAKYPLAIGISGAIDNTGSTSRALVVGSSEVAGAWVRFQCPLGEVEIVPNDPNNLRLQVGNNFCCRECTNRRYWNCERSAPTPRVCHASNECIPPCYVRECADPVQPCEFS